MRGVGAADVLIGEWPEPDDEGKLATDERRRLTVRLLERSERRQVVEVDGIRHAVAVVSDGASWHTSSPAGSASWELAPRFVAHEAEEAGSGPVSPLPGTVIAVQVAPGDAVAEGDVLMVIEAMKMEHKVTASGAAHVAEVRFSVGDRVDTGDLLVRVDMLEPDR